MSDKTPSEILFESLQRNAEELRSWPQWMRDAASTAHIFRVAPAKPKTDQAQKTDSETDDR